MADDDETPVDAAAPTPSAGQRHLDYLMKVLIHQLESAIAVIETEPDAQQAFLMASRVADELRALEGRAADVRARQVSKIYDSTRLSLAGLANLLGISKARAAQLRDRDSAKRRRAAEAPAPAEEKGDQPSWET